MIIILSWRMLKSILRVDLTWLAGLGYQTVESVERPSRLCLGSALSHLPFPALLHRLPIARPLIEAYVMKLVTLKGLYIKCSFGGGQIRRGSFIKYYKC
jgi:hypothetical protein